MAESRNLNILDLPTELLIKIFGMLECFDILNLSLVCQRFLHIFQHPNSSKEVLLKFENILYLEECPIETVFNRKIRTFPNISLIKCNLHLFYQYLLENAHLIQTFDFQCLKIPCAEFLQLLEQTKHLTELNIKNCTFLNENLCSRTQHTESNLKLKTLSYLNATYNSINLYLRLFQLIDLKYLKNIKLSLLQESDVPEQNCCCEFLDILTTLELHTLEIHNLQFNCCKEIFFKILENNRENLKNLMIIQCNIILDTDIVIIAKKMINLKEFGIIRCFQLTNVSAYAFENLHKLETLTISACSGVLSGINSAGVNNGIAKNINTYLSTLNLIHIDINTACMIKISKNAPNLKSLLFQYPMSSGRLGCKITDFAVQAVIKNLKLLQNLELIGCSWVTDFGVTGDIGEISEYEEKQTYSINQLNNLETLNLIGSDKVTDSFILNNNFQLIKLRVIRIPKLSLQSMIILTKNCKLLEQIEFQCDFNTAELVQLAIQSFCRLKSIKVTRYCNYCKNVLVVQAEKRKLYTENIEIKSGCLICCKIRSLCRCFQMKE